MGGIAGVFFLDDRPASGDHARLMLEALAHRGPAGTGTWREGPVSLVSLSLHATPQACGEVLPYADAERGLVIVADARLDNRDELLPALGGGRPAGVPGDAQPILQA